MSARVEAKKRMDGVCSRHLEDLGLDLENSCGLSDDPYIRPYL